MGDLLLSVVFIFLFAWVARAMLGARELTWRRTFFAALLGLVIGQTVGVMLLIRDVSQVEQLTAFLRTSIGVSDPDRSQAGAADIAL